MSDLVWLSTIALICMTVTTVSLTVIYRQALRDAFRDRLQSDDAHRRQVDTLLDRLQTIKWEDYAAIRSLDDEQEGGFIVPEYAPDDEDTQVLHETAGRMRERLRLTNEERQIIDEDFDNEGNPR